MNRQQDLRSATRKALLMLHNPQMRKCHGHEPLHLNDRERDIAAAADLALLCDAKTNDLEQRMRECKNMLAAKQKALLRELSRETDNATAKRLQVHTLELAHAAALCQCIASTAHLDHQPSVARRLTYSEAVANIEFNRTGRRDADIWRAEASI